MTGIADSAPVLAKRLRQSHFGPGIVLGLFSLCSASLLALSDDLTRAPIAARAAEDLRASLSQVVPEALHDNDLTAGQILWTDPAEGEVPVYLARRGDVVTAVAFALTGQGYSGAIRVLIAVDPEGTVLGVRVLAHTETPGLGDKIEAAKSAWIEGFDGRSLVNPDREGWALRKDGGIFDHFSGASITPRAVVGTVHRGLSLFARQKDTLFQPVNKETGT